MRARVRSTTVIAGVGALAGAAAIAARPAPAAADPAALVMPRLEPADALTTSGAWLHGRDPGVDAALTAIAYRHRLGARSWLEGEAGVAWAALDAGRGLTLANATIGAGYRVGDATWLRARVGLPSAADGGSAGAAAGAIAALRLDDRAQYRPATTSLLVAADWRFGVGEGAAAADDPRKWFAQVEAGAELWAGAGADVPALRVGAAGGVKVACGAWLVAELTTLSFILDERAGEDFEHALDLGASIDLPRGALALRLEVPLDDVYRARDAYAVGVAWRLEP